MIRVYGKFKEVSGDLTVLSEISLTPFDNIFDDTNFMFLDLNEGKSYQSLLSEDDVLVPDWKPVNGNAFLGEYVYNKNTGDYINSRIIRYYYKQGNEMVELENGEVINLDSDEYKNYDRYYAYQEYKDCKPVGDILFEY